MKLIKKNGLESISKFPENIMNSKASVVRRGYSAFVICNKTVEYLFSLWNQTSNSIMKNMRVFFQSQFFWLC